MLDLHCHILPGVDDGSLSQAMTLEMGRCLVDAGFNAIAASPHYGTGPGGDVSIAMGHEKRLETARFLKENGIELDILPNAEHYVSPELFERVAADAVVPIGGNSDWLLIELPWKPLSNPEEVLFRLQMAGYKLLLAHPERYKYLEADTVERLVHRGIKLQLELGSFVRVYGRRSRKRAVFFADNGWAHVLASDLHRPADWLADSLKAVRKRYGSRGLKNALEENPRALISNAGSDEVPAFV